MSLKSLSYQSLHQKNWKQGLIQTFSRQGYTHALTLAWNRSASLPVAIDQLKHLHGIVDGELLGPRFNRKPKDKRTPAVFVFEGLGNGGHLHTHSLWRIRDYEDNFLKFATLFPEERGGCWNSIVSSGSYKLDVVDNPERFANYALKGQHMGSADVEIIWSDDFLKS